MCPKVLYQVELSRTTTDQLFGFSVEAELSENSDHQDELCVYVSRVEEGSLAHSQGLIKADEIMVINGAIVADLDMMFIESVLQEELSLCMMVRSSRMEAPDIATGSCSIRSADNYIESLVRKYYNILLYKRGDKHLFTSYGPKCDRDKVRG